MPALGKAKTQARSLVCKSNIRLLAQANISFTFDNNDHFVAAAPDLWQQDSLHRWHGSRNHINAPFDSSRSPLIDYLSDARIQECPELIDFVKGQWNVSYENGSGGYGYNMIYIGSRLHLPGATRSMSSYQEAYATTPQASSIKQPSETLMFADVAMPRVNQGHSYYIETSFAWPRYVVQNGQELDGSDEYGTIQEYDPTIHFRHGGFANVAWIDGHVTQEKMAYIESSEDQIETNTLNTFGADAQKMNVGWFAPLNNSLFDLQ